MKSSTELPFLLIAVDASLPKMKRVDAQMASCFRMTFEISFYIVLLFQFTHSLTMASTNTVLYTHRMCPYAQKVWIALNLAGKPYTLEEIDLYGNKPSWFLKMNPKGQVPVLQHNGQVITESEKILDFIGSPQYLCDGQTGLLSKIVEDVPDSEKWWRDKINKHINPIGKRCVQSGTVGTDLKCLISELESNITGPYLAGQSISLADACAFPFLYRLNEQYRTLFGEYPNIQNWLKRMESIDEVSGTIVSSWWWWW